MGIKLTDLIRQVSPEVEGKGKAGARPGAPGVYKKPCDRNAVWSCERPRKRKKTHPAGKYASKWLPVIRLFCERWSFRTTMQRMDSCWAVIELVWNITQAGANELLKLRKELSNLPDSEQLLFVTEATLRSEPASGPPVFSNI